MRTTVLCLLASLAACKSPSSDATDAATSAPSVTASASVAATVPVTSASPPATPPPANWWTTSGHDQRYMRFTPNEIALVETLRQPDVHDVKQLEGDASHWAWSDSGVRCTLDMDDAGSGASFRCRDKAFTLQPLADARKGAALDANVEKSRPAKDVCVVAEACGTKVFAMMSSIFDADRELGNPRSPQKCKKALPALRAMAQSHGPTPAECQ